MGINFAGAWKRIKNFAGKVGDGIKKAGKWLNTNVVQPILPFAKQALNRVDSSGLAGDMLEYGSNKLQQHQESQGGGQRDEKFSKMTQSLKNVYNVANKDGRLKKRLTKSTWDE